MERRIERVCERVKKEPNERLELSGVATVGTNLFSPIRFPRAMKAEAMKEQRSQAGQSDGGIGGMDDVAGVVQRVSELAVRSPAASPARLASNVWQGQLER